MASRARHGTVLFVLALVAGAAPVARATDALVVQADALATEPRNRLLLLPNGEVIHTAELRLAARVSPAEAGDALVITHRARRVRRRAGASNSFLLLTEPQQRIVLDEPNFRDRARDDRVALFAGRDDYFFPAYPGTDFLAADLDAFGALVWVGEVIPGYARRQTGASPFQPDTDADRVPDVADNCVLVANGPLDAATAGPAQYDTNGDGFGNRCDADLNGDCIVNVLDLGQLRARFFTTGQVDEDFNGDGVVNVLDLGIIRQQFFAPPGPSGLASCP